MDLPANKGESQIYRHHSVVDKELFVSAPGITNLQELYDYVFAKYKDNEMLGMRGYSKSFQQVMSERKGDEEIVHPPLNNYFTFITTKDVEMKVKHLGSGITNLKLAPEIHEFEDWKVKFVGIYAKNSIEWFLIDIACAYFGFSVVPIYDT